MSNIVEFPTSEGELNMAPYAASTSSSARYTLYGICNHMGKRLHNITEITVKINAIIESFS